MFKKKECKRCGEKISDSYDFCPHCGTPIGKNQEGWGMLGRNDFIPPMNEIRFPRGLNTIFNSLMRNIDKQFEDFDRQSQNNNQRMPVKKSGISINISSSPDGKPKIRVNSFGDKETKEKSRTKKIPSKSFSKEQIKKFSSLPRKEPETSIKRLADKITYEVKIPSVKSIEDISIIRLESSIEIRAIAKTKSYLKIIPINLPLINYNLSEGKLVLEFCAKC